MGYDFYCTHCASTQNAGTVLYDMKGLLTTQELNILKLRLSEKELRALLGRGKKGENNLYQCTLSLQELLGYMANSNNLNLPTLPRLTLEEIRKFVTYIAPAQEAPAPGNDEEDGGWDEEDEAPAADQSQPQEPQWPPIIDELIRKDSLRDDAENAQSRLRDDLRLLLSLFGNKEAYTFGLMLVTEEDDRGNEVVVSTTIHNGQQFLPEDNRICGKCGEPIFKAAGTAEHKSIVFIGEQSAGKTSTILALTHYAEAHLKHNTGNPIWCDAATNDIVQQMKLLAPEARLHYELNTLFPLGVAPRKTDANERKNAYSATFLVTSGKKGKKVTKKILTLMDLPGELCLWGGELNQKKIVNDFPVALACDTFVVCFDTSAVEQARKEKEENGIENGIRMVNPETGQRELRQFHQMIDDTCQWADAFQDMLIQNERKQNYVPAILVFTKCQSLENPQAVNGGPAEGRHAPEDRAYMLQDERIAINADEVFRAALESLGQTGKLNTAYNAALRASPYGYAAPAEDDVEFKEEDGMVQVVPKEGKQFKIQSPTPKNIDKLMRWLLMVSGCIPTEGAYHKEIRDRGDGYQLRDYILTRPQLRTQNPLYPGENPDEALARCILFANPTEKDKEYLRSYGDKPRRLALKFKAMFQHGGRS